MWHSFELFFDFVDDVYSDKDRNGRGNAQVANDVFDRYLRKGVELWPKIKNLNEILVQRSTTFIFRDHTLHEWKGKILNALNGCKVVCDQDVAGGLLHYIFGFSDGTQIKKHSSSVLIEMTGEGGGRGGERVSSYGRATGLSFAESNVLLILGRIIQHGRSRVWVHCNCSYASMPAGRLRVTTH